MENSIHYQTPNEKKLQELFENDGFESSADNHIYNLGKMAQRYETITLVINLLKENPNIDGLEILKQL